MEVSTKYQCGKCKFDYDVKKSDDDNKIIHICNQLHKCTVEGCNKLFNFEYNLKKHKLVHIYGKFKCKYAGCNEQFTYKGNKVRHEKQHTGIKPYRCRHEDCDKSFFRKDNRDDHEKIYHIDKTI